MQEREIQHAIRLALGDEPDLILFRNTVGAALVQGGRRITYGLCPGSADLVGVLGPRGRWFCLEVKQPGKHSTAEQKRWADLMRARGAFVAEVSSVDDARNALSVARDQVQG